MPSPLNVLITNSTGLYGGGEYFVLELARALRARGHRIWVSCKPDNLLYAKCLEAGISLLPLDFPPKGRLIHFVTAIYRAIKEYDIQIVHTNSNYDRTAGAFAAWRAGVPHVTNVHSLHSIQHNLTHRIRNRMMTDRFLADGVRTKDLLVTHDHIPSTKISVFYHGVNPDYMRRDEHQRHQARRQFGFTDDDIVVGNIARMVPMKGQEYLLQAFAIVGRAFPHARLVIVGDGELYHQLTSQAQSLDIHKQITFTGFREDLQALFSSFDIYAHSSIEGAGETISFAVQQALAHELPVVVTRVGDVAENVLEGTNGFIVPERDAQALAERLTILVKDRPLRQAMGNESRKYLLQRFTTEHMVSAVEENYAIVLEGRISSRKNHATKHIG